MKQFFEVVKFISELFLLLSNAACFFEVTALHLKSACSTRCRISLKPFRGARYALNLKTASSPHFTFATLLGYESQPWGFRFVVAFAFEQRRERL
ncbi:hypothetical protein [Bordetella sp. N]|uniref:hypothetical protein n=1 Tax=Bordetella sp. N TaxID=1746199 RepID=UPI0012E3F650|nr:hypothetical protein [Bordetella sp. N]